MPDLDDLVKDDDVFLFSEEDLESDAEKITDYWKILIVDDEPSIHHTTKLVLRDITYEGKGIEFVSAYSSLEAREILNSHNDIAIILLDVVMEADDAGLVLCDYIRNELKNKFVRIILRTGQPGQAPEEKIILQYDINDYKTKTELTVQKLFTTIISSIRSYRDLITIEKSRLGLIEILNASGKLFEMNSLKKFVSGLITQFTSIYGLEDSALFARSSGLLASDKNGELIVVAASGDFQPFIDKTVSDVASQDILQVIKLAYDKKESVFTDKYFLGFCHSVSNIDNYFLMKAPRHIENIDKSLLKLFYENIALAFDNIVRQERIINSQRTLIFELSDILENTASSGDSHLMNMSKLTSELAHLYGISEEESHLVGMAAVLHDIGNRYIDPEILSKPGHLDDREYTCVKLHSIKGSVAISNTDDDITRFARLIARGHHENWDGSGYPDSLQGEEIPILCRIVTLCDVFETMLRETPYRKAQTLEKTVEFIKSQSGRKFDPNLVDIFVKNIDFMYSQIK